MCQCCLRAEGTLARQSTNASMKVIVLLQHAHSIQCQHLCSPLMPFWLLD